MRIFATIIRQDIVLAWRSGQLALALIFMLICASLLPLGLGTNLLLLRSLASGFGWLALLLATFLSLDALFQADYEDGRLDQLILTGLPLEIITLAKAIAHFIAIICPLILSIPLVGIMLNIDSIAIPKLMAAMLTGAPVLSCLGTIAAAITLRIRRASYLIILFMVPLAVPILILGANVLTVTNWKAVLLVLALLSFAAICLAPLAAAAALRANL